VSAEATPADTVCVILAGGPGKRMASRDTHKACFPIAGTPAIVRAIDTFRAAGLARFIVVVGHMAEQVMATVAATHPDVTFAYQADPRGTGHAAAVAVHALVAQGHRGNVVVAVGDMITRPEVVRRLLSRFSGSGVDLVATVMTKRAKSTAGRVVRDGRGDVAGVVELPDINRARREDTSLRVGSEDLSADEVEERSGAVNASLYAFRFPALEDALRHIRADNAQSELYLTDTVGIIARGGRVEVMEVSEPTDLMAFNNPAELLAIEEVVRGRESLPRVSLSAGETLSPRSLRPLTEWLRVLEGDGPELRRELRELYGPDDGQTEDRRRAMLRLVRRGAETLGGRRRVIVCRAPGRINLMGRHVDHRGGYVNVMAVSREVLLVAAPREDDKVTLQNLAEVMYPAREFRISDLLDEASWTDWMDFLDSGTVRRVLEAAPNDWSHYARAPMLRLQHESSDVRLKGMDCLVSGDIPIGAGLSSSSALVVAFAEATVKLNGLDVAVRDFVDLCGEGEWFVGSRGGSADHAAIHASRAGYVTRIGFFPFRIEDAAPLPEGIDLVVVDSGETAVKSAGAPARDAFNQRVACYEIAERLLRQSWPPAAAVEHFRDLAPGRLQVEPSQIYGAIARLPDRPSRRRIRSLLPENSRPELDRIFSTHANLGGYDLRGVALYGIGECIRGERFAGLMRDQDLGAIGRDMRVSHDGDRRWRFLSDGSARRSVVRTDDATLGRLAVSNADMSMQPGRYGCSTRTIDRIVDTALSNDGVIGAQISGAGLGGCAMVLVRSESRDALVEGLMGQSVEGDTGPAAVFVCRPVAGAGLVSV
jgi:N-acetylgalactosamine kinase